MNKTTQELKQVPSKAWIKITMVISVLLFGLIIPYNLTVEANFNPLYMGMGIGFIPMFFIFLLVRKKLWKLHFDSKHKENYFKLLIWAFLFSSIFHTPILLINQLGAKNFTHRAKVVKVNDSYIGRDYVHPPHLVLDIEGQKLKIRMDRYQLEGMVKGKTVQISGIKGSLGYLIEAQVK